MPFEGVDKMLNHNPHEPEGALSILTIQRDRVSENIEGANYALPQCRLRSCLDPCRCAGPVPFTVTFQTDHFRGGGPHSPAIFCPSPVGAQRVRLLSISLFPPSV